MKSKSIVRSIFISIVPLSLIVLNIFDMYDVIKGQTDYPFGSDFFSKYSIYSSKEVYLIYNITFILLLILTIILAFKENWKQLLIFFGLDLLFFFYPFIN